MEEQHTSSELAEKNESKTDVLGSTSSDKGDTASGLKDEEDLSCDLEKYQEAFKLLWPDSDGKVHKDKLLEFFQGILGSLYSADMATCLIDIMNPDEEGFISMENFVHAFSLAYWTPESVAAMHNVLVTNPEIISKLADWKNVLKNLGLEMSDKEVSSIIQMAQKRATALLSAELSRSSEYSPKERDEVHRKSGEILNSIHAKLSAMDLADATGEIGNLSINAPGEDESVKPDPKSTQDIPPEQEHNS